MSPRNVLRDHLSGARRPVPGELWRARTGRTVRVVAVEQNDLRGRVQVTNIATGRTTRVWLDVFIAAYVPTAAAQALTDDPCPRCLALAWNGALDREMVQRLPAGAGAPLAHDGSGPCCRDCGAADSLRARYPELTFPMARLAVGNDRREQYRLPGVPMGLVLVGIMQPSAPGDLEAHHAWMRTHGLL